MSQPDFVTSDTEARKLVDQRLPFGQTAILGLQHVLAMYAGAVAVPLIVGSAIGLSKTQLAFLITADLFTCGIATLLQSIGLFRNIGIRLPVMLGVTFTAVGPMIAIGGSLGLPYVYGSIIVSGIFVFLTASYFGKLRRFFPPIVTGSVVTIIGTSLLPVALNWAAGGIGAKDYGSPFNLALALGVLLFIIIVTRYARGFIAAISVLLGLLLGTIVAASLGHMSLAGIGNEPWLAITKPFWFGLPKFNLAAALTMILVALVSMVESTGVFFAIGKVTGINIKEDHISNGLRAEGLAVVLGAIFNSFPYTTFSQNVGLVALTRVRSRFVVAAAGIILILLGLLPKFAYIVASIPSAVLGGAGLVMFGMVAASGIRMLSTVDYDRTENLFIVAVSVGLGLGVSVVPQMFEHLNPTLNMLVSNGIVVGSLSAIVLNYIFNYRQGYNTEEELVVAEGAI